MGQQPSTAQTSSEVVKVGTPDPSSDEEAKGAADAAHHHHQVTIGVPGSHPSEQKQDGAKGGGQSGPGCRPFSCLCSLVLDVITVAIIVALSPLVLVLAVLLFGIPFLDRLCHPKRHYLDGVSCAFLQYTPEAIIHAVLISKERMPAEKILGQFTQTYLCGVGEFHRLKDRVVKRCYLWPYWTDASADFDPAYHLKAHPEPVNKDEMELVMARLETQFMDIRKPLWDVHYYENYTDEHGRPCSAIVYRCHHALGDGFTGLRMMMQGSKPNKPPEEEATPKNRAQRRQRLNPLQSAHYLLVALRKIVFMMNDPVSNYKTKGHGDPLKEKNVTWHTLRGITVPELKALGKELGGATINDILVAALAGALRTHATTTPGSKLQPDVTTCAWVSLFPMKNIYADFSEFPFKWGNSALGGIYITLPAGAKHANRESDDILTRLRGNLEDPSLVIEAVAVTALLSLFGWLPQSVGKPVWKLLANKVSASMSNVPGPQFDLEWCGLPVRCLLFLMPPTGRISLFVTIATYRGEVTVGLGIEKELMSAQALHSIASDLFEGEIRRLRDAVARGPLAKPEIRGPRLWGSMLMA